MLSSNYRGLAQIALFFADLLAIPNQSHDTILANASSSSGPENAQNSTDNHQSQSPPSHVVDLAAGAVGNLVLRNFDGERADQVFTATAQPPAWLQVCTVQQVCIVLTSCIH
jgi:hypothetical protein